MANSGLDHGGSGPSRTSAPGATDSYETIKADLTHLADTVKNMATNQMGSAASEAQDQVKQKLGDVESAIRNNPTQAALIAAGVGFLVGLVMTR